MSELESKPRVPYTESDSPPWAPGHVEPGRTPEQEALRKHQGELDAERMAEEEGS